MNIYIDYEKMFNDSKVKLRELNVPIASDENISFNLDDKLKTNGLCTEDEPGKYTISIRTAYVKGKNIDLPILQGLMYHELIHTCEGCFDHKKKFCDYAKKVYKETGINPNKFEPIDSYRHPDLPIKVKCECENCGRTLICRTDRDLRTTKIEWFIDARLECTYCGKKNWVEGYGVKRR